MGFGLQQKFDFELAKRLEKEFHSHFDKTNCSKQFFTYLLLDPRITLNLVEQAKHGIELDRRLFRQFVQSIFYIGKGQGNRPFMHLYEAALLNTTTSSYNEKKKKLNSKLQRILQIWNDGYGVISLHCFH